MQADYPYGPREPGKIEKTLDVAVKILDDPFPDPDDDLDPAPVPREVGREWAEHWRAFAAERGFAYRGGVSAPGFAPDERDAAFLAEMRALRLPLNEVMGLCRGEWQDVPFTSFDAINFGAKGTHWPYRFVCTPLGDAGVEVVHDRALTKRRPYHAEWYPGLRGYRLFTGPWNEPGSVLKVPGVLKRTAFGRGLSKAVEQAADRLTMPKLHTTSLEQVTAIAAQPFDQQPFRYDWAVRGGWLVVFHAVPERTGDDPSGRIVSLLDGLVAVQRLWERAS